MVPIELTIYIEYISGALNGDENYVRNDNSKLLIKSYLVRSLNSIW